MVTKQKADVYAAFAERLNEACDDNGLPENGRSKELGQRVGIGYKGAEKWLKGQSMPDQAHAAQLAVALGVGFEWLMTARGPKRLAYAAATAAEPSQAAERVPPVLAWQTADVLTHMPEGVRLAVRKFTPAIIELIEERPYLGGQSPAERERLKTWLRDLCEIVGRPREGEIVHTPTNNQPSSHEHNSETEP